MSLLVGLSGCEVEPVGSLDADAPTHDLDAGADAPTAIDARVDVPVAIDARTDVPEPTDAPPCEGDCRILADLRASLRVIAPGTFAMGSPRGEPGALGTEFPEHPVTISRAFLIGATEVTVAQYRAVTGESPSHFTCGDDCPVENVSWGDTVAFANALSAIDGLEQCYTDDSTEMRLRGVDCTGYRLPTEAEWEYAARAGTTGPFYNGGITNTMITDACSFIDPNSDATAWNCGNSGLEPHPVGGRLPNEWGLYDVYGNVWEWVNDWETPYTADAVTDPLGGNNDGNGRKMRRGGSYRDVPRYSRSAMRVPDLHSGGHWCIGFRIARTAPG